MLYVATLRLIDNTKAIANSWLKEWREEYETAKLIGDGTVQFSVEELPRSNRHIAIPFGAVNEINYPEVLDTVFRQGYAASVRDQVTFGGWK